MYHYNTLRFITLAILLCLLTSNNGVAQEVDLKLDRVLSAGALFNSGPVIQDQDGFVWIGTDAGLFRFNTTDNRFTRYRYDSHQPQGLPSDLIHDIFEYQNGCLWLGRDNGGKV